MRRGIHLGAYGRIELPEVVMAEYHRDAVDRPIPQIPYVETGNAGERVLQYLNPMKREELLAGRRSDGELRLRLKRRGPV